MNELQELGVFDVRNGSAELFFDDEGIIQQIVYRKNKRKREGEEFQVLGVKGGKATANYHPDGTLLQVTYETTWRRKLDKQP